MSCDSGTSTRGSSHSGSSGGSSQNILMMQKDKEDLTLYGTPIRLSRSATVRRATTLSTGKIPHTEPINVSVEEPDNISKLDQTIIDTHPTDRYRKSLDSTYRHSLESISEYKTKHSFSSASLFPSRDGSSIESSSSDCTDYAMRSTTDTTKDKTFISASSSYLSWIESVNSEYFGSANSTADVVDVDAKVGEWNNFWLNYNSANNRYLSSPYLTVSHEDKTVEDLSDCKSTCSTQREFTEKQISLDQIFLSHEEIMETLRCSQRITEILQNALKRNEADIDESRNDSYYSQTFPALFSSFRISKKEEAPVRERARSYSLEPQELQKQKQMLKPPTQSSNSCINVLLNTGVGDILKRVMSKRREVITTDDTGSGSRSSFSDWSSAK
ncbi:hypothetical protein ILUMI_27013 [Ignelater luminosus]|uniref:Uncharacterized protein n=1 Tax=Ignelater luminosus TaxID=2038154 RepID=A0A8K0C5R1_IGNLU|nr:hypothetical protein ILUMI_27013 [Ignelater luminosus]